MKHIIFIIVLICSYNLSFGQNFSELANYKFKTAESYKPAESKVLTCANYLFNNPTNKEELNRQISIQYIIKWMTGTPDYSFNIGEKVMELTKGNPDLLGLYMAAISKVVIDNTGTKLSNDEIYSRAEKILVNYCSDSNNKIKPSKKIKQLLKAKKE